MQRNKQLSLVVLSVQKSIPVHSGRIDFRFFCRSNAFEALNLKADQKVQTSA